MRQFIYPAIFYFDEDETKVYFPDLDISTSGDNYDEAFLFAKELLKVYFMYVLTNDLDFNFPSNFKDSAKRCGEKQKAMVIDAFVTDQDLKEFRKKTKSK